MWDTVLRSQMGGKIDDVSLIKEDLGNFQTYTIAALYTEKENSQKQKKSQKYIKVAVK